MKEFLLKVNLLLDPHLFLGANAVVIGRSNLVGLPVSLLLMHANATVTICHSRTKDMETHLKNADIVVAAIGQANFVSWTTGTCLILIG